MTQKLHNLMQERALRDAIETLRDPRADDLHLAVKESGGTMWVLSWVIDTLNDNGYQIVKEN